MLEILCLILKIIGWLVLGIIGLLLVLILLILFVPIPYHIWVNGDSRGDPDFSYWIKVFGLQVIPRREKKGKKPEKSKKKQTEKQKTQQTEQKIRTGTLNERSEQTSTAAKSDEDIAANAQKRRASDTKNKSRGEKTSKGKGGVQKALDTIRRIYTTLTDPDNRSACAHVLREVNRLLRFIGPRRLRADAAFSLGDPSYTGYATAALSVCPFVYGKKTSIIPDFVTEEFYIKGWMDVRGHVCLIHVAAAGIRLYLDKNIRTIIKTFRR